MAERAEYLHDNARELARMRGLVERLAHGWVDVDHPGDVLEHRAHLEGVDELSGQLGAVCADSLHAHHAVTAAPRRHADEPAITTSLHG